MTISIALNEFADAEVGKKVEGEIVRCIGDRPADEKWDVWIHVFPDCCRIVLKGPAQTRERFFFDDVHKLQQSIRDWLESYPLK